MERPELMIPLPCVIHAPQDMENLHNYDCGVRVVTPSGEPIVSIFAEPAGEQTYFGFLKLHKGTLFSMKKEDELLVSLFREGGAWLDRETAEEKTKYLLYGPTERPLGHVFCMEYGVEVFEEDGKLLGWGGHPKGILGIHKLRQEFRDSEGRLLGKMAKCRKRPLTNKYPYLFESLLPVEAEESDVRLLLAWVVRDNIRLGEWSGTP
jgi:hypothetical protein